MPRIISRRQTKRRRGNAIAEMPVGLFLLFLGIGFPMLLGCAMTYKVFLVYFAVRDACIHGAKCSTWADNGANLGLVSVVNNTFTQDINGFNASWRGQPQLVVDPPPNGLNMQIWQQPIAGGAGNVIGHTSLTNADQATYNYSLQLNYVGRIQPFLGAGWGGWLGNVPGLSAPLPLTVSYQTYCESPKGLAN